jgi:hypothetical protein
MAKINNSLNVNTVGIFDQNNRVKNVFIGAWNVFTSIDDLLQEVNLTVSETDGVVLLYAVNGNRFADQRVRVKSWFFPLGKGVYEPLSDHITEAQLVLNYESMITEDDIRAIIGDANTVTFNLGDISGSTLTQAVNTAQPVYNLNNVGSSYVFTYSIDGLNYTELFIGELGIYGQNGTDVATDDDFVLLFSSDMPNTSLQGLQSVTTVGNITNNQIIIDSDNSKGFIHKSNGMIGIETYVSEDDNESTITLRSLADSITKTVIGQGTYQFSQGFNATVLGFQAPTSINQLLFPDKSGVIATIGDIVELQSPTPNLQQVTDEGNETDKPIKAQYYFAGIGAGGEVLICDEAGTLISNGVFYIRKDDFGTSGISAGVIAGGLTLSREYILPDKNGTFAMLDDIPTATTPNLQEVLDEGNESTTEAIFNDIDDDNSLSIDGKGIRIKSPSGFTTGFFREVDVVSSQLLLQTDTPSSNRQSTVIEPGSISIRNTSSYRGTITYSDDIGDCTIKIGERTRAGSNSNAAQIISSTTIVSSNGQPLSTDDETKGYVVGSLWWDKGGSKLFKCVDSVPSMAQWEEVLFGSSNEIISTRYQDLEVMVESSSLVPGQRYSFEYLADHRVEGIFIAGAPETFIITAKDNASFYSTVESTSYPNDIIYYEFTNESINDSGLPYINGSTTGQVLRRIDPINNNDICFDFRNLEFPRWEVDLISVPYSKTATYVVGDIVRDPSARILYCVRDAIEDSLSINENMYWIDIGEINNKFISTTRTQFVFMMGSNEVVVSTEGPISYYKLFDPRATSVKNNKITTENNYYVNLLCNIVIQGDRYIAENNDIHVPIYQPGSGNNIPLGNTVVCNTFANNKIKGMKGATLIGESIIHNEINNIYRTIISSMLQFSDVKEHLIDSYIRHLIGSKSTRINQLISTYIYNSDINTDSSYLSSVENVFANKIDGSYITLINDSRVEGELNKVIVDFSITNSKIHKIYSSVFKKEVEFLEVENVLEDGIFTNRIHQLTLKGYLSGSVIFFSGLPLDGLSHKEIRVLNSGSYLMSNYDDDGILVTTIIN